MSMFAWVSVCAVMRCGRLRATSPVSMVSHGNIVELRGKTSVFVFMWVKYKVLQSAIPLSFSLTSIPKYAEKKTLHQSIGENLGYVLNELCEMLNSGLLWCRLFFFRLPIWFSVMFYEGFCINFVQIIIRVWVIKSKTLCSCLKGHRLYIDDHIPSF